MLKRAEGDGEGFIVIDDLVDTGGTAVAIREMYPKAHFVTIFAKPAGRPLVGAAGTAAVHALTQPRHSHD